MPGERATFFCTFYLPVEWIACNISSRAFITKSLPWNTFDELVQTNKRALVIHNIVEDNYGTYCCKYENPYLGQYYVEWANLVKGNLDNKKYHEFLPLLPNYTEPS